MSQFEALIRCEVDKEYKLLASRFVNGLRAYIKREVKVQPLYSLDCHIPKSLEYEKYLCIVPRCVSFNPSSC